MVRFTAELLEGKRQAFSYQLSAISLCATRTLREQLMGKVSASFAQRGHSRSVAERPRPKPVPQSISSSVAKGFSPDFKF
ncbi:MULTISPECIES: hypothetical protein [unclassified Moorena]|uniref:hypothetical protein n=1 Tax=unclassified Moorena TaxID=2683338 RepID=UPI0013B9D9D5|nr:MULTISPECIES: hypothetical protein [unclassified Moorena]NEQ15833.1 hypothetical protein [Moorena sp. SIO3E2]NEP31412.1 hypothetical protein [Moorena sp. SIO3B2]NEQ05844.1 hypothetical protein [Moorena sp. SIO4E2]NER90164.1 hypothetical protein [Moorena sp. SIO3A2]NES44551.1 hypothetical protein [Moorena sp. SIO2C4]